jgi:uncharacterized DUF497 family protein
MRLSLRVGCGEARENRRKHGVSFEEAIEVLNDALSITIDDPDHSTSELRHIDIGVSDAGQVLVVSYTERWGIIRVIGCRKATPSERRRYEEGIDYAKTQ